MSALIKLTLLTCQLMTINMPEIGPSEVMSCGQSYSEFYARAENVNSLVTLYNHYETMNEKGEHYVKINVPYCRITFRSGNELDVEESCKSIAKQVK